MIRRHSMQTVEHRPVMLPRPGLHMLSARLKSWMLDCVAALLLFFLLKEWLVPLAELPDSVKLYYVPLFIAAMGSFLALDLLRLPLLMDLPIKACSVLLWVALLYYPQQFPLSGWWNTLAELFVSDWNALRQGAPELVSGEARTLLFLLGIAMLVYVLFHLMLLKKTMIWLTLLTVVYLLLLQIGYGVDTTPSVVKGLTAGLLLSSVVSLHKKLEQNDPPAADAVTASTEHGFSFSGGALGPWFKGWLIGTAAAVGLSIGMGWGGQLLAPAAAEMLKLPDRDWTLADFVPEAMKNKHDDAVIATADRRGTSSTTGARTGYSDADSRLGGPVTSDTAIVFAAWTEEATYWRGESRDYYDGQRWSQSLDASSAAPEHNDSLEQIYSDPAVAEDKDPVAEAGLRVIVQQVLLTERAPSNRVFAGGTIRQMDELLLGNGQAADPASFIVDSSTGAASLVSSQSLKQYSVETVLPERGGAMFVSGYVPDSDGLLDKQAYLQLPAELPDRVKQLASDLTAGYDSDYDKAKAIEHFLRTGYTYSMDEAVVPPEGEDFVDYFLFEHPLGYCDYFSTAMVVLLRAADVPARWVKGFAPGEIRPAISSAVGNRGDSMDASDSDEQGSFLGPPEKYLSQHRSESSTLRGYFTTVRNADAHSWPEVYLPEYGWVAFEPTPGFAENVDALHQGELADKDEEAVPPGGGEATEQEQGLLSDSGGVNTAGEGRIPWEGNLASFGSILAGIFSGFRALAAELFVNRLSRPGAGALLIGFTAILLAFIGWKLIKRKLVSSTSSVSGEGYPLDRLTSRRITKRLDDLWMRLYRKNGPRMAHMTLREYVGTLELTEEENRLISEWINWDEQLRYGRRLPQTLPDSTLWKSWRDLTT